MNSLIILEYDVVIQNQVSTQGAAVAYFIQCMIILFQAIFLSKTYICMKGDFFFLIGKKWSLSQQNVIVSFNLVGVFFRVFPVQSFKYFQNYN